MKSGRCDRKIDPRGGPTPSSTSRDQQRVHHAHKELFMNEGVKTIIYPVRDLARAKTLFGALLEREPVHDAPYYVGFKVEGQDVGLDPNGHSQGMTGPLSYFHVDDLKKTLKALLDAGAEALEEVKDVGGGKLIASVKDADGNVIGLIQSA
jgi:predicted enzyme related to lactoylglutathione lyase